MNKYLCLCGKNFNTKKSADKHAALFNETQYNNIIHLHLIMKRNWQARLGDVLFDHNWRRFFRFAGGFMLLMVLEHHFQINFTQWESVFLGIGMGLYIE